MDKVRFLLAVFACLLPPLAAARDCAIEYRFTADWNSQPRRFHVDLLFDAGNRTSTVLGIAPQWGPITDFERAIRDVRPVAPAGVVSTQPGGKAWTVDHPGGGRVQVRYEMLNDVPNVDANGPMRSLDFFRSMLGATWFQFYGWGALLLPESIDPERPIPVCLRFLDIPRDWSFATSHGEGSRRGRSIEIRTIASPHDLQSAIYLGGDFRVYRRDIRGRPLVLAMRGRWRFDDARLVDATASVVRAQRDFWRDYDFPHYLVSLIPNHVERGLTGGTGLRHSFAMHAADDFTVPGPQFDHLIAHEHLHTWIPRRIGTMGEDEARSYWFSEGFTDYLTHRLLLESGLWTIDDYAKSLDERIVRYESSAARNATDAWIATQFWSIPSAQEMPYLRGEMLALRWASAMTARGASLQSTLRSLLLPTEAREDPGDGHLEKRAVRRLAAALRKSLGASVDRDVANYVDAGKTIPIGEDFLGPCFAGKRVLHPLFDVGFDQAATSASGKLTGLLRGSAAEGAGLREGMTVVRWSVERRGKASDVQVQVEDDAGKPTQIRYREVATRSVRVYEFHPRRGAARDAACRSWIEAR